MTQNKQPDQLLRVGQEVRVMDRGKWQKTSIKSIDYMDTNNEYPYRFHLANGQTIYNSNEMDWQGKPKKIKPKPYIPRQWDKNQKVKFMPYSSLSLKPEYGIIQDSKDGIVTILTTRGTLLQIPEVNITSV